MSSLKAFSSNQFVEIPCSKSNMPMNNVNIPGQILHHIGLFRLSYAKKFRNTHIPTSYIMPKLNTLAISNFKSDEPQEIWQPFLICFQRLHHVVHQAHLKPVCRNHCHIFYQLLLSIMPFSLSNNHFPNKAWLKHKKHLIPKSPYSIC